jgi:starch synthase
MSVGRLSIAHVASEMAPLAKAGGLADVVGALSIEQARRGHRVCVALPAYRTAAVPAGWSTRQLDPCEVPWGMARETAKFTLREDPETGLRVLLVGHAGERRFFDRSGLYDDPATSEGYPDNPERFLFFSRAALEGLARLGERFDVVHAHDHQAGWVPCLLRTHLATELAFGETATVFTIHNLGYPGITDAWVLGLAGFGGEHFNAGGPFEYWGRVNFMKVGLVFADMLSTVSPRYAVEIQESGEFGLGLEGVLALRSEDLRGILNGIDDRTWNPATDPLIPHRYDAESLDTKRLNRAALAAECGLSADDDTMLVGMVTRLVEQKGIDLVEQSAHALLKLGVRLTFLGSGQPRYVDFLRQLATTYPERVSFRQGHDEALAHRIEAGADLFLMPSRYEPCGLNQMYSLRYGTPPLVRAVGGLADTVVEFDALTRQGTGFLFQGYNGGEMVAALRHAHSIWKHPELWRHAQLNGMRCDFSWRRSADRYDVLYAEARERLAAGRVITLAVAKAMLEGKHTIAG